METITLSADQKENLSGYLVIIDAVLNHLRQELPEVRDYTTEKLVTFLQEVRILQTLDTALKENFQPCASAYESALDAVGQKATVQNKEMAGVSPNTSKFNMKPGKTVSAYVGEILRRSGKKKAYFAVRNRYLGKICIVPANNFAFSNKTYINWSQLTRSPKARLISG